MFKYIAILFFTSIIFMQNEGFVIDEIDIIGNNLLSDDNIKFISGLEEGIYINNFNIQNSIKRLWDTKRYLDIQIEVDKQYLNNKVIIHIQEAPFIGDIVIQGNKQISDRNL